jgi:hypothetical protein
MRRPSPAQGALDLASAACAFDAQSAGPALAAQAMDLGIHPDVCAALACALDAPNVLALALTRGANPRAIIEYRDCGPRDLAPPSHDGSSAPTLLRRALMAQSPACAQILMPLVPDPWTHLHGSGASRELGELHPCWQGLLLGASGWDALRLALSKSTPSKPTSIRAQALASALAQQGQPFFDRCDEAGAAKALALFERLAQLGADLAPHGATTHNQPLFVVANALTRAGNPRVIEQITSFVLNVVPHAASDALRWSLSHWGCQATPAPAPGLSWFSRPAEDALREQCLALAQACPPERPALLSVLLWASQGAVDSLPSPGLRDDWNSKRLQERQARSDAQWLFEAMPSWPAPDEPAMELCAKAARDCEHLSIAQSSRSDLDVQSHPQPHDPARLTVEQFPSRVAAACCEAFPALAPFHEHARASLAQLAQAGLLFDADALQAQLEACLLAGQTDPGSPSPKPPRL